MALFATLCGGMSQSRLADALLVWGWWCPSSVDADGELVGVGVQRSQQRDVGVFGAACAAQYDVRWIPPGRVHGGGHWSAASSGAKKRRG
jgi:hypothetical protein